MGYFVSGLLALVLISTTHDAISMSILEPTKYLIKKFESKIDTNLYFIYHYRQQAENPGFCTSADGPFCKKINNQSLADYVLDDAKARPLKDRIIKDVEDMLSKLESVKNPDQTYFFYPDDKRKTLDERQSELKKRSDITPILLDFEVLKLTKGEHPITYSYTILLDATDTDHITDLSKERKVVIDFTNFLAPSIESVNFKEQRLPKDLDTKPKMSDIDAKKNLIPSKIYVSTPPTQQGVLTFSEPVTVKQVYLRKHRYVQYASKGGDPVSVDFQVIGYLNKIPVLTKSETIRQKFNQWNKIEFPAGLVVDQMVFDPNTDIDNLYMVYGRDEKKDTKLSSLDDEVKELLIEILPSDLDEEGIYDDGEGSSAEQTFPKGKMTPQRLDQIDKVIQEYAEALMKMREEDEKEKAERKKEEELKKNNK